MKTCETCLSVTLDTKQYLDLSKSPPKIINLCDECIPYEDRELKEV